MQHKFQTQQQMLTFLNYQDYLYLREKLLPYPETPRQSN